MKKSAGQAALPPAKPTAERDGSTPTAPPRSGDVECKQCAQLLEKLADLSQANRELNEEVSAPHQREISDAAESGGPAPVLGITQGVNELRVLASRRKRADGGELQPDESTEGQDYEPEPYGAAQSDAQVTLLLDALRQKTPFDTLNDEQLRRLVGSMQRNIQRNPPGLYPTRPPARALRAALAGRRQAP